MSNKNSAILNKIEKVGIEGVKIEKSESKDGEIEKNRFKENRIEAREKVENDSSYLINDDGDIGIITTSNNNQRQKEEEKKIEKILETDLENAYLSMSPEKRQEFKKVGEETTKKIVELIDRGKASVKKIISLIKKWLSLIPGANKFFLEQEAKIKTDEILKIRINK